MGLGIQGLSEAGVPTPKNAALFLDVSITPWLGVYKEEGSHHIVTLLAYCTVPENEATCLWSRQRPIIAQCYGQSSVKGQYGWLSKSWSFFGYPL